MSLKIELSHDVIERIRDLNASVPPQDRSPTSALYVRALAEEVQRHRLFLRAMDDAVQQGVSPTRPT